MTEPEWATDPALRQAFFDSLGRTVAVDFDGVLHPYTAGWVGSVPADEPPTPGAREFLAWLVDAGFRVVVFSTRCDHPAGLDGVTGWLEANGLASLVSGVTHEKPAAVAYVDDRAVPFSASSGWSPVVDGILRLAAGRSHGAAAQQ